MFPQSHQEIARAIYADRLREATQERLAAAAREGRVTSGQQVRAGTLVRWTGALARWAKPHRPAVRTA